MHIAELRVIVTHRHAPSHDATLDMAECAGARLSATSLRDSRSMAEPSNRMTDRAPEHEHRALGNRRRAPCKLGI